MKCIIQYERKTASLKFCMKYCTEVFIYIFVQREKQETLVFSRRIE